MAKFTPDAVEPIAFDLSSVGGPKGEFPEPSQALLDALVDSAAKWQTGTVKLAHDLESEKITEAKARNELAKLEATVTKSVVALSGGVLTDEQLDQLPPRVRTAFMRYIVKETLDPTELTPGTRRSPAARNGAAART